ncbi:DUF5343 domain-containing protein [Rhizobium sp. BK491]|uniref:DUF5343 domain-containing protein n=1 Tax=unclassified Rhizobium TaxID=2613769 RepID=UPI000DD948D2|nr:DUF5343 domain-containing protein [Rhizobium sp. BK491]MBB3570361.1 hypothetical protein [Rhizobium sp. BK491]
MATHPYISGAGNISQMIAFLRKNFPPTVTSDTVRKLGLASKNESYVINVLQFIGLIDEEGKRTEKGHEVLTIHNEADFQKAFGDMVRNAYADLFSIRGDDAWTLDKDALVGYFRSADKTSDIIGTRQAGVFTALRELAGHGNQQTATVPKQKSAAATKPKISVKSSKSNTHQQTSNGNKQISSASAAPKADMALTVRVEINLPAEGTQETYDAIFKSIRANLFP